LLPTVKSTIEVPLERGFRLLEFTYDQGVVQLVVILFRLEDEKVRDGPLEEDLLSSVLLGQKTLEMTLKVDLFKFHRLLDAIEMSHKIPESEESIFPFYHRGLEGNRRLIDELVDGHIHLKFFSGIPH
jgi:hypothetical protein